MHNKENYPNNNPYLDKNTQQCHISVMKKTGTALGALALVVGVMPAAMAQTAQEDARDYVIEVQGTALPTSLGELDYPYNAARLGRTGKCAIRLEVSETGTARNFDVKSCSHAGFERAASKFAETLEYPPSSRGQAHDLVVSWTNAD